MKKILLYGNLLFLFVLPIFSAGSIFKLDNNETFNGKGIYLKDGFWMIENTYGLLKIPVKKIVKVDFYGENLSYEITLSDKSIIKGNPINLEEDNFTINTASGIITIPFSNVAVIIEEEYGKLLKKQEEERALKEKLKEQEDFLKKKHLLSFLGGYSIMLSPYSSLYKNGLSFHGNLYFRVFEDFWSNLRLGLKLHYEKNKAKTNDIVDIQSLTYAFSAHFSYPFLNATFFPYVKLNLGQTLLQVTKQNKTTEAGLNNSVSASLGADYYIYKQYFISLEALYFVIYESGKTMKQIQILMGGGLKF